MSRESVLAGVTVRSTFFGTDGSSSLIGAYERVDKERTANVATTAFGGIWYVRRSGVRSPLTLLDVNRRPERDGGRRLSVGVLDFGIVLAVDLDVGVELVSEEVGRLLVDGPLVHF